MTTPPSHPDSIVDAAVASLRDSAAAGHPPAAVVDHTIAALQAHGGRQRPAATISAGRPSRPGWWRLGIAAAVGLAAGIAVMIVPGISGREGNAAFAAMLEKVREAKSVRYRSTVVSPDAPEPAKRVTLLAIETADAARLELPGMVTIFHRDGTLLLQPESKTAITIVGSQDDDRTRRAQKPDLLRQFRDSDGGMGERIEDKQVGSIAAVGYRLKKKLIDIGGEQDGGMRVYVDPATELPVRIEQDVVLPGADGPRRDVMVMSDFEWNVEVDPALVSLDPPAGYRPQQMTMERPVVADRAAAIAAGLRFYADHVQGDLPRGLDDFEPMLKLQGAIGAKLDETTKKKLASGEVATLWTVVREVYGPWFGMLQAIEDLEKKNIDVQYLGKGMKAGDATQIIAWWKADKAGRVIAIYGDFSVKEIDESAAPPPASGAGR